MSARPLLCLMLCGALLAAPAVAEDDYERPPISYSAATPDNTVTALQARMDAGEVTLKYDNRLGYLASVLSALNVPVESQMFVFSKTSLQLRRISPRTPRAIYFNDDVYIGFCQSGDVLEVSAVDPQLGTVFYTLDQEQVEQPRFERRVDNCLVCHSSSRTEGVPGHLVRSLYVDREGTPLLSAGSRIVDHTTPLENRWGGWYVTGTHGPQTHLGNLTIEGRRVAEPVDNAAGQNLAELDEHFSVDRYLSPHSDIVALMILEHQTLVHNRLTKASFATRQALAYEEMMREMLEKPADTRLESTTRRIESAGEDLVEALLFAGEARLTAPIRGTSGFAELFPQSGSRDRQGRSLRDLDMQARLLKYPCSYLIDSSAFHGLPQEMKEYVWKRLLVILSGQDDSPTFAHLTPADRQAILEILRDTHSDLPDDWRTQLSAAGADAAGS